jgi:hypothetical protein
VPSQPAPPPPFIEHFIDAGFGPASGISRRIREP